jgi:hypothetical protein
MVLTFQTSPVQFCEALIFLWALETHQLESMPTGQCFKNPDASESQPTGESLCLVFL